MERFLSLLSDQERCLPVVLVADSKTEISQSSPVMPQLSADKFSFSGFTQPNRELNVTISTDLKNSFQLSKKSEKKLKENLPSNVIKKTCSQTKLPVFDYSGLANSLLGFAVVVFTDEKFFRQIENKVHISIDHGDILLITKPETIERFSYEQYRNDMQSFFYKLKKDVIEMQKRSSYSFGSVMFYSDAKLKEYKLQRYQTDSLEEKCHIYKLENTELKLQINELSQQQNDMHQTAENLRIAQKRLLFSKTSSMH